MLICCLSLLITVSTAFSKGWHPQEIPDSAKEAHLQSVCFIDSMRGWAVGEKGVVLATEDGGITWIDLTLELREQVMELLPGPVTINLYSVIFADALTGWCAGEAVLPTMDPMGRTFKTIFQTEDGGRTWTCQYPRLLGDGISDTAVSGRINDIYFLDRQNGWATGTGYSYLVTHDGGITWEEQGMGWCVIPEMRMTMTSSKWLSPCFGMITGYTWDMNDPDHKKGFIATTGKSEAICPADPAWDIDMGDEHGWPPLNDIEVQSGRTVRVSAWAAGDRGAILRRTPEGKWERCQLPPWPNPFTLPYFRGINFSDARRGWAAGYFRKRVTVDPDDSPPYMTIFKTLDAGDKWQPEPIDMQGQLHDVAAVDSSEDAADVRMATDVWAVGTRGTILHYHNSPPVICSLAPKPAMVYAGEFFLLQARVDDLDNPFEDIVSVTADASSLGLGDIELEYVGRDSDDRRCILYEAKIEVPSLAKYGSHPLSVTVKDTDNAIDTAETSVFVITSWVDILEAWAKPEMVPAGCKVSLNARVVLIAPKVQEDGHSGVHNRIERVMVNISDLLGIDCSDSADCEAWIPMKYDPDQNIYSAVSRALLPGCHKLPVIAVDTLGHTDRDIIEVCVMNFDYDHDGDVDGQDLAKFIASGDFEKPCNMKMFAMAFGR